MRQRHSCNWNGENKMNEYEEEILEQRAQDWDYDAEDAQEM